MKTSNLKSQLKVFLPAFSADFNHSLQRPSVDPVEFKPLLQLEQIYYHVFAKDRCKMWLKSLKKAKKWILN